MNAITTNPWTSSAGVLALLGAAVSIYHSAVAGTAPDTTQLLLIYYGITSGIGLLKAKDWNVTGGTKPQTVEAVDRTGPVLGSILK